jgi:hypothetical protein
MVVLACTISLRFYTVGALAQTLVTPSVAQEPKLGEYSVLRRTSFHLEGRQRNALAFVCPAVSLPFQHSWTSA